MGHSILADFEEVSHKRHFEAYGYITALKIAVGSLFYNIQARYLIQAHTLQ